MKSDTTRSTWVGLGAWAAVLALAVPAAVRADAAAAAQEPPAATAPRPAVPRVRVVKQGGEVWVRSALAPTHDVVVMVGRGENGQVNFNKVFSVPTHPGMKAEDLSGGAVIHANGDDSTPWNMNGTYIGANHGCSDARVVTSPEHGLTAAELGSEWVDEAGAKFYVMKVPDADSVWLLSENTGTGDVWKFNGNIAGMALKRTGAGAALKLAKVDTVQLRPACRINRQQYLVDREPWDGQPTDCDTFDIVDDYDVINPGAVLADVIAHPGEQRDFAAQHLPAVVSNHVVYRFLPNGANVIYYRAEAKQDFNLGYMGFVQAAPLAVPEPLTVHDYYIPKTLPFTQAGKDWDFRAGQDYTKPPPQPLTFSAANKNVDDPSDLPDRFVQLLGHEEGGRTVYDVGFALGYSPVRGLTVPAQRAANTNEALVLYSTAKTYPRAADSKMNGGLIKSGTGFDCVAYRQYFWPGAYPNATCVYWHPEADETVVYIDYHKAVDRDPIRLPAEFTGRTIRVVEKTPSLTLHSDRTVPADGLSVSVTGSYGALVVAIK